MQNRIFHWVDVGRNDQFWPCHQHMNLATNMSATVALLDVVIITIGKSSKEPEFQVGLRTLNIIQRNSVCTNV